MINIEKFVYNDEDVLESIVLKHGTGDQTAHGNWARGRVSAKLTQSILDRVKANGGLSVNMKDGSEPTKGYMVASPVKQAPVVDADDFFNPAKGRKILGDFVKANKKDLGGGKKYLGLWHNKEDNKVYLDVSENVQDKSTATRLGRERNQISIWDVVNFEEIGTGGTGVTEKRRDSDGGITIRYIGDDRRTNRFLGGFDLQQTNEVVKHGTHDQSSHAGSRRRIGSDGTGTEPRKPQGEQDVTDPNAPKPKLKPGRKPDPSGTIEERAEKLADGKRIQVTKKEAKKIMKIMAKREDNPDLTNMHIEDTQLYDEDNLGIPRNQMPQVPSDTKAVFVSEMEKRGARVQRGVADPSKLHPIQAEMSASKVGLIMKSLRKKGMKTDDGGRIIISKDNFVIDGHHRWAAAAMLSFEDSSIKLPVIRVDMNHKDLIAATLAWNDATGIRPIGMGESNQPGQVRKAWAEFDFIIAKAIRGRTIVRFQPGLKPVVKHQQHDQQSHGSWAQQKPNLDYEGKQFIEETLPWAIAEAQKRGYGPAYTMGQIPKDETVPQGLRNLHDKSNQKNSSIESAKALEFYTSDNYKKVNNALRDGTFNPQDSVVTDIDIIVNDLDSLISQSNKTSATVEVFRGIKGTNSLSDLKVGQGFTDKAYTSTTLDPRLALTSFSSPSKGKILRITVPKGTKGIYVPDWFGAKDERAQTKKEQEFILPRGSSFRVTNIDGNVISLEMDSIE